MARARVPAQFGGAAAGAAPPNPLIRPVAPVVVGGENAARRDDMDEEPVVNVVMPGQLPKRARHDQQ